MSTLDHKEQSQSRIYAQYRDKPKAFDWYGIVGTLANEIEQACCDIRTSYDIDNVEGAQLDVIGRIVGVNRGYETEIPLNPFQYGEGDPTGQYGAPLTQYSPSFLALSEQLSDSLYRLILKAKIAKNNSDATLDSIIQAVDTIVDAQNIRVIDNEDMSFAISFGSTLNDVERFALTNFDIVPRPQGVRFVGFTEEPSVTQYGGATAEYNDNRAQFGRFFT